VVSRAVVGVYVRAYGVDLDEAEPLTGIGCYPSFDAFFTRSLRHGARTWRVVPGALSSPADGRLDEVGRVSPEGEIHIKGRAYHASDLLGPDQAPRYYGGQFAVIYLSPRDYHRVHAPAPGALREVRSYPGELFPVNSVSERHIPRYLARNRRVAIVLETEEHATVTVVMVAAMIVGRITVTGVPGRDVPLGVHRPNPSPAVERGDEIGVFHLGSTAVVFVEPGRARPFDRAAGPVRLGEPLTVGGNHA
jgi:phosphatidylserine decarboxylase